jgi:hypothetical protein
MIITIVSLMLFTGCLSGQKSNDGVNGQYIQSIMFVNQTIVVNSNSLKAIPSIFPIITTGKFQLKIDENCEDIKDVSKFSSEFAITFWNHSDKVIVADAYKNALLVSPASIVSNVPLLIYGDSTTNAIKRLGATEIVCAGNVPIQTSTHLKEDAAIYDYILGEYVSAGKKVEYVALVNTNESSNLSALAPIFAYYRQGIIVGISNQTFEKGEIKYSKAEPLHNASQVAFDLMHSYNMTPKYVCLVGAPTEIPYISTYTTSDGISEIEISGDSFYGFDGNLSKYKTRAQRFVPPIIVGRIGFDGFSQGYEYVKSVKTYNEKLASTQSGLSSSWNDRAAITGNFLNDPAFDITMYKPCSQILCYQELSDAGFHTAIVPDDSQTDLIKYCFENSNFIYDFMALSVSDNISDWEMNPSVVFSLFGSPEVSGFRERYDFIVDLFKIGSLSLVAPINIPAYYFVNDWLGNTTKLISDPLNVDAGMGKIGRYFFSEIIKNKTVGEAFWAAKAAYCIEYADNDPVEGGGFPTIADYDLALYGDPAFNPYEPCNEGSA